MRLTNAIMVSTDTVALMWVEFDQNLKIHLSFSEYKKWASYWESTHHSPSGNSK